MSLLQTGEYFTRVLSMTALIAMSHLPRGISDWEEGGVVAAAGGAVLNDHFPATFKTHMPACAVNTPNGCSRPYCRSIDSPALPSVLAC